MNNKLVDGINKLISFNLPLLAFLIAVSFYLRTYDSCQIKITLLHIGGTIILSLWLIKVIEKNIYHSHQYSFSSLNSLNYLNTPVICFLLSGILSLFLSPFKATSFEELTRRILYIGIFFVALNEADRKESIKLFFWPLIIGAFFVLAVFNEAIFPSGPDLKMSIIKIVAIFLILGIIGKLLYKDKKEENVDKIIRWIILATFLAVLYGLLQYFDTSSFPPVKFIRELILGFLMEKHLDPFIWRNAFGYRIFSTFGNPNFFAAFLVLVSPLIYMEFLRTKKKKFLILFFMNIISVVLTVTKASWVGFAAASSFCAILSIIGLRSKIRFKKILITGVVIINLLSLYGVTYYSRKRIDSLRFRIFTWLSTVQMIKKHPILGFGIGTFKIVYPAYRRPEIFHIEGKHNTETDHPENEFLEVWYDEGIVGFIIFLWVIFVFFFKGIKKIKQLHLECLSSPRNDGFKTIASGGSDIDKKSSNSLPKEMYYLIGILAGLFGLLVHNLMCVNMRFVSSGFFFWLFLGLVGNIILRRKEEESISDLNKNKFHPQEAVLIKGRLFQTIVVCICLILVFPFWPYGLFPRLFLADLHHNIAIAYSKQRIWNRALMEYKEVLRLNPFYIMAHYFMGNVYNDRKAPGDEKRALRKYADVKRLAPNYVQVHFQEALVYLHMANQASQEGKKERVQVYYEKAISNFNKAQKLDPVFGPTYFKIAWCNLQLGRYNEAKEVLQSALTRKGPNYTDRFYADCYINLANILTIEGKFEEAEKEFKKAIEVKPDYITAYRSLAAFYTRLNWIKEAIIEWKNVLKLNPQDKVAISNLDKLKESVK